MRYLGVELHRILGFKRYIAMTDALSLSRLMPNIGGSRQRKRKSVVNSQLLYASPVWVNALMYDSYVDIIVPKDNGSKGGNCLQHEVPVGSNGDSRYHPSTPHGLGKTRALWKERRTA